MSASETLTTTTGWNLGTVEDRQRRAAANGARNGPTAIPAGDPVSWGAITAGTWLDGERYPGSEEARRRDAAGKKAA